MIAQFEIEVPTHGRGALQIGDLINKELSQIAPGDCLANVFVMHTSASLMITGNEDPNLLSDIEGYLQRSVPDGDTRYLHNNEGDFDTSGHIRSILTSESKSVPVVQDRLALGCYQGLFLYEHRAGKNLRKIMITLV